MIIALDARPLISRKVGGAEQHARNIVAQWAQMGVPHEFLLLCDRHQRDATRYDQSFVEGLPGNFRQRTVGGFAPALRWYMASRSAGFADAQPRGEQCGRVPQFHARRAAHRYLPRGADDSRSVLRVGPGSAQAAGEPGVAPGGPPRGCWARRIVAVSTQTKNDIASLYAVPAERIAVVYNGINPVYTSQRDAALRASLRERYRIGHPYVIAVGSDIPRRNYARMLEAMIAVWKGAPALRLLLAGQNDWLTTPVFRQAQETGVLDRIIFVRGPTDAELAQLYRDATLTCCASSFEGFGMSVLESMACGTPVACSDMRSLREVADDAALYFPHDDPETMGESVAGLLQDVEYRRQLKYRGLARAAKFTWATAARLVLAILEDVGTPRAGRTT